MALLCGSRALVGTAVKSLILLLVACIYNLLTPLAKKLLNMGLIVCGCRFPLNSSPRIRSWKNMLLQPIRNLLASPQLSSHNLLVIVDNHMSNAEWCCNGKDGNGLWYTDNYSESAWLQGWENVSTRYASYPNVIGADLRNELRSTVVGGKNLSPTWASGDSATDWRMAAGKAAAVLARTAPHWLVIVEGLNYALKLEGFGEHRLNISQQNKLVYSSHNYEWDQLSKLCPDCAVSSSSYSDFKTTLDANWGYLLKSIPVWLGEFGTCNTGIDCIKDAGSGSQGRWFQYLRRYLAENGASWSYWAIDGTESTGSGRKFGAPETYGILDTNWTAPSSQALLETLQSIQPINATAQMCDVVPENWPTDNMYAYIYCGKGEKIANVTFASFGTPVGKCGNLAYGNCNMNTTAQTVAKQCVGLSECSIHVSTSVFGDPCPDVDKTLAVSVACSNTAGF
eukprot:m.27102 g.27102  ORF g.27102 m.27102 type:complete len:453 (-) comp13875_c0_seq2:17-1375(-)